MGVAACCCCGSDSLLGSLGRTERLGSKIGGRWLLLLLLLLLTLLLVSLEFDLVECTEEGRPNVGD